MTDSPKSQNGVCLQDNKPNNKEEVGCPWYIDAPEYNNCFWQYVKAVSAPDGSMPELVQSEIAKLLGWSNTKTHFMLKQAMLELTEALKTNNASELLKKLHDEGIDLNTYNIEPITKPDNE